MNVIYSKEGLLIKPHLEHTLKSFFYACDVNVYFQDVEGNIHMTYPSNHWTLSEDAQGILQRLQLSEDQLKDVFSLPHPTYTITIDNQYIFLLAPVLSQGHVKGFMVAGPISLCRCSAPNDISELTMQQRFLLSKHVTLKKPPCHLFIAQLMHHLVRKSIHIGPNEAVGIPTQYLSRDDMSTHYLNTAFHEKLELVAQMVLKLQKQEALSFYKKSLLLQGLAQNSDVENDVIMGLKQQLFTLETLISSAILKDSYEPQKMMQLKNEFFKQIMRVDSYPCLVACGENMIKVYSETLRRKELEGISQPVRKCILYIQEHFKQTVTLELISAHVKKSKAYLSTRFREEMHMTISEYIKQTRITYSKHLLQYTDASILEIALESGFENQNYFATVFKSVVGKSPAEFRKIGPSTSL